MQRFRFSILLLIVFISGLIQGALIPLLSTLIERDGTPAWLNGLNATMLYLGVIVSAPLLERFVRKYGFRPTIVLGIVLTALATFFLPLWPTLLAWAVMRFVIGFGDSALHYGSQVWVTSVSEKRSLGRAMAYYGMSFSLGFAVGPLIAPLVDLHFWLPFLVLIFFCLASLVLIFKVENEFPEAEKVKTDSTGRIRLVLIGAGYTLLPAFTYGFLEASLNANLPIFTVRNDIGLAQTSTLITTFIVASILVQLPLGRLADHFGKKRILQIVLTLGTVLFALANLAVDHYVWLLVLFALAGAGLGSTYSLGLAHMTEVLPRSLLPTGNMLYSIAFSVGSISGPMIGAFWISLPKDVYFLMYTLILGILAVSLFTAKAKPIDM
ncbi:MAG: MFS transporter [Exiguobacterium sp.]|uniref:MFS transporter n=1 Tax=Exiguobacterium alkaliphilum TaxID=1428684 RepID=A0ABT2KT65_9BACL|nr:MFS transporter [Exiguobacterium alkaliphilum]MDX5322259.1 MFS transporter [Exiguobacterium sp.]MCT4794162.1 MFS transporter [Exiguobacterium alkaliphilum]MDX5423976.1 MFS transporter [Exiguobacterium sp.]MDX6771506.1 MFS transporter [Exiguobacterium sp.]QUE86132.1 MFS transporter [Exiguobacterium alkaliphilum]